MASLFTAPPPSFTPPSLAGSAFSWLFQPFKGQCISLLQDAAKSRKPPGHLEQQGKRVARRMKGGKNAVGFFFCFVFFKSRQAHQSHSWQMARGKSCIGYRKIKDSCLFSNISTKAHSEWASCGDTQVSSPGGRAKRNTGGRGRKGNCLVHRGSKPAEWAKNIL